MSLHPVVHWAYLRKKRPSLALMNGSCCSRSEPVKTNSRDSLVSTIAHNGQLRCSDLDDPSSFLIKLASKAKFTQA
ncbi:hypothetical protein QC764_0101340 [Podospora pseudoanserina]|uniref:Glutamine amidotransferase type-2 domain-containing protein n=1 Tax=Podospora pseudoanserina TaxID=2609844 RepID=A0ABR0HVY0_9PEZI|nr:hypothetical protein QC764_0101340 [Podospora pseudoanserina]